MPDTPTPYTAADLRAEAARQHYELTRDPDYCGVGEQMEDKVIPSRQDSDGTEWDELGEGDFDTAQRTVHDLIDGAADVSAWAVDLGADGLEPSANAITLDGDDKPLARIHFAFSPDMDEATRAAFAARLAHLMAGAL